MEHHHLHLALRSNAAFSLVSAAAMIIFRTPLADVMGIGAGWVLPAVAAGLVLFAFDLLMTASRAEPDPRKVRAFVVMDVAWVVGSGVLIALGVLTATGSWIVGGVACVVGLLALAQATAAPARRTAV